MFVVGATRLVEMKKIRELAPDQFFLVPGVGAQGGDLKKVCECGFNNNCGLLVNSSRSIIYAGKGLAFKDEVRLSCLSIQKKMQAILKDRQFI